MRAAEQLPLQSLDAFAKMTDGQAMLNQAPNGVQVVVLAGSRSQPVGEEQARPAIEQFLLNERKRKLIEDDVKAMRAAAKIEYVGKFGEGAPAGAAPALRRRPPRPSPRTGRARSPRCQHRPQRHRHQQRHGPEMIDHPQAQSTCNPCCTPRWRWASAWAAAASPRRTRKALPGHRRRQAEYRLGSGDVHAHQRLPEPRPDAGNPGDRSRRGQLPAAGQHPPGRADA